jgi:ribosomal protein L7/L12
MPIVIFKGWNPGLNTIALIKQVRDHTRLGLKDAFDLVDRFVEGEQISIDLPTEEAAESLATAATSSGAIVAVR